MIHCVAIPLLAGLVLLASEPFAGPPATIETLTNQVRGRVARLDGEAVEVVLAADSDRRTTMAIGEVVAIRWEAEREATNPVLGEAVLANGSVVVHRDWSIERGAIEFVEAGGGIIRTPVDAVVAWRFPHASPTPAMWAELATRSPASDLVVVRKSAPETIDYVEGVIVEIQHEGLRFAFDATEEPIDVPWRRVFGLVFARRAGLERDGDAVLETVGGSRITAESIASDGADAMIRHGQVVAELPLGSIACLDLSAGKVQWLDEAELIRSDWRPYFAPRGGSGAVIGGPPRRNHAFDGGPLKIRTPDARLRGATVVRTYDRGWAIRSRGEVVLRLEPWARRLRGWVGVDPATAASGVADVTLLADEEPIAAFRVDGTEPPVEIDARLSEATRLRVIVDYGLNLDTGDNVHFVDFRATR